MKKIQPYNLAIFFNIFSILAISIFLRINLNLETKKVLNEFKTQNYLEIYSIDTLKISNKLTSLSSSLNWACIEASTGGQLFYKMSKSNCSTGIFKEKATIIIPEANNLNIALTLYPSGQILNLYFFILLCNFFIILSLYFSVKKQQKDQLSEELKFNQLSRQIFHDIKSPLAVLNTITTITIDQDHNEKKLIQESIKQINETANKILSISKKEIQLSPINYFNIKKLITETISIKKIEYSNIEINLKLSGDISCLLSETDFKNVLSNIINNSFEATSPQKTIINIEERISNDKYQLIIKDNGPGIPINILQKLGQEEVTSKKTGNGIGILYAKNIINSFGGQFEIESSELGTSIIIELNHKIENRSIILLDNDELTRINWEYHAAKANKKLKTFSTKTAFYKQLEDISKDTLIYLDSELGNDKGEDIAIELHQKGFHTIYLTTGHSKEKFAHLHFLIDVIDKNPPF